MQNDHIIKTFIDFIDKNRYILFQNLQKKFDYEDCIGNKFFADRTGFYNVLNNNQLTKFMENFFNDFKTSDLVDIFEQDFLTNDEISKKFIRYEFINEKQLLDSFYKKYPINYKPKALNLEKIAKIVKNVFLFILDQTKYELMHQIIDRSNFYEIKITFNHHKNCN